MDIKTLASNLANRVNQEHYIEHELKKVYLQGFKDSKAKEMLEMLVRVNKYLEVIEKTNNLKFISESLGKEDIEQLIEEATKID